MPGTASASNLVESLGKNTVWTANPVDPRDEYDARMTGRQIAEQLKRIADELTRANDQGRVIPGTIEYRQGEFEELPDFDGSRERTSIPKTEL